MIPNGIKKLTDEDRVKNSKYNVGSLLNLSKKDADAYFQSNNKPWYPESWVLDQGEFEAGNDECAPISLSRLMSFLNGYHVAPHFLAMMTRMRTGAPIEEYGHSLRDVADAGRHVGALKIEEEPFSFKDGREVIYDSTRYKNLTELVVKANENIIGAVTWIEPTNGMDYFDTLRATIAKYNTMYGKHHGAVFGMTWNYPMEQVYIKEVSETGGGHAIPFIWFLGDYALAIQSYGTKSGSNGEQFIHRDIINRWAKEYGLFVPIDASKAQIDALLARGGKLDDPLYKNLVAAIFAKINAILKQIKEAIKGREDSTGAIPSKIDFASICLQESDARPDVTGDHHLKNKAYGIAQIRQVYMSDVYPKMQAQACLNNVPLSMDVFYKYMARWCTKKRLGREPTFEDVARIHNGGPNGYKNPNTLVYYYQAKQKRDALISGTPPKGWSAKDFNAAVDRLKAHGII